MSWTRAIGDGSRIGSCTVFDIEFASRRRSARPVRPLLLCAIALCAANVLGGEEPDEEAPSPVQLSHGDAGHAVLTVDAETRARIQLATAELHRESLQPTVKAYGLLEEDPGQSFTLRSPVSGYLRPAENHIWPSVGDRLDDGVTIALVEPRLSPTESLDLLTRWMEARAEIDELAAEVEAARSSFENKKRLNEEGKLVSDRSLEDAELKLKSSIARLGGAKERVDALERVMPGTGKPYGVPLVAKGGNVVEVAAHTHEAIESGQALLRVTHFEVLIARASIPVGAWAPTPPPAARLAVVGKEDVVLSADPVGRAPSTSPAAQGDTLLYRVVAPSDAPLRPGMAIIAEIPTAGAEVPGTIVPRSAVLRYGGLAWVYVATSEEQFVRRTIELAAPLEKGWFVSSGVTPGESVVIHGAQSLLSEELKAQIESEEEAEE